MKLSHLCLLSLIALLAVASPLRADILYMNDGRKIEGKIIGKTAVGYIVEIASGSKKITAIYSFNTVREIEIQPVTANDRLMAAYNEQLVEASKNGAEGFRSLAHWCAGHDELADERKSAWRALLGLAPDDQEAHAALGQVKAAAGGWQTIDEKMAANGFVRRGNTWVRDPLAAKAAGAGGPGGAAAEAPVGPSNSVLERSGFNKRFGGSTGYTTEITGPGVQNGSVFIGRTGYPYLEVLDAAGIGIFVPLYNYPGSYYLTLPSSPGSGPAYYGNNPNISLADRGLTGSFFPTAPATKTVTQNGTTFTVPANDPMPQSDGYNSQGYDQNGIKVGPGYREPVPPAEYTPTGTGNQQVINSDGVVTFQGANYDTHSASGYSPGGFRYSPNKVVTTGDAGIVTNGAGYNTQGLRYAPGSPGTVDPYLTNGAGYTTGGYYTQPMYAPVNVFMVNGAGYSTLGTQVAPFYSGTPGGVYGYGRYSNFQVDLYGSSRGTNYNFGLNAYGLSFDLNGKKGNTAWSLSFR